jgi:hypothetical protein
MHANKTVLLYFIKGTLPRDLEHHLLEEEKRILEEALLQANQAVDVAAKVSI